jgi:DNA-directed RNA polymerase subunit beta'
MDQVLDNGRVGLPRRGRDDEPLESVGKRLKGKQGRLRKNMLGKRVDFSSRTVIVTEPSLKLDQLAMPYEVARGIYVGFLLGKLLELPENTDIREDSLNFSSTGCPRREAQDKLLQRFDRLDRDTRWQMMESVMEGRRVMINRAPTLHRLSIQSFQPVLREGFAMGIHPLVCAPFNADFDGDTMSLHLALSEDAQLELRTIMSPKQNLVNAAHGDIVYGPSQDMVLGFYFLTSGFGGRPGAPIHCASVEALQAVAEDVFTGKTAHSTAVTVPWEILEEAAPDAVLDDAKLSGSAGEVVTTNAGRILFFLLVHRNFVPQSSTDMQLVSSLDAAPLTEH